MAFGLPRASPLPRILIFSSAFCASSLTQLRKSWKGLKGKLTKFVWSVEKTRQFVYDFCKKRQEQPESIDGRYQLLPLWKDHQKKLNDSKSLFIFVHTVNRFVYLCTKFKVDTPIESKMKNQEAFWKIPRRILSLK